MDTGNKRRYRCGICGREFDKPDNAMECEFIHNFMGDENEWE